MTDDSENPIRINKECKIRPCVIEKGLDNCAYCEQYPCEILEPKMIDYQEVVKRYGSPLPQEDYELFVQPYENRKVLDELREEAAK
jgi:Zn-finger protein